MKVNLIISDDDELRAAVRDVIQAEIKSVMRAEVRKTLADVVQEKVATASQVDTLVREEVRRLVTGALSSSYSSDVVKQIAREEVQKYLDQRLGTKIAIN